MASHPNSHPIPPASNLSHCKRKRTSSSTAIDPSAPPPLSSFADHPEIKYDVFLSFRGPDTRSGVLSHLLEELNRKKIDYFVDDQNLKQGDEISSTLLAAIKKSEISLVLFSEDYASSKWCLKELEQIIQCMKSQKQVILPIFYKIDPSTVRHQKGSYHKAFGKLGERFDKRTLQKWQTALRKASDLSGFDSSDYKTEAMLIKAIVERVLTELRKRGNRNNLKGYVGIHKHIRYLETRLNTDSHDILAIGIWGMGGIGKTTIAEILYNRLCNKYEGSHLLCIKEELVKGRSIRDLKKDLLSKLLGEVVHDVTLNGTLEYVERRLLQKKVLIVLDDISDSDQVEILIGHVKFGFGSRIIMTSRDKQVFVKGCDEVYEIEELKIEDALQLSKQCLEESKFIKKQELCVLSKMIVNYAKGVPLVIKVLCHDLSTTQSKLEWKNKLEKLKKIPNPKIQKVLELSYDGLADDEHKDIFLYLTCFFRNEPKERIIMLLHACGYHTIDGLRALQDKALITVSNGGFISMHDLIQDMGCEIVRKKSSKELARRSHLWNADDIYKVFKDEMGTQTIESIRLNIWRLKNDLQLGPQAFAGMNNLKLLQFDKNWRSEHKYTEYPPKDQQNEKKSYMVHPPEEGFESLPKDLISFYWEMYPLKSFPLRCSVNNLVELRFEFSNLQRLWDGVQELPSLKVIDLSNSRQLIELPDLSKAPNLESVYLSYCDSLSRVPLWPDHFIQETISPEAVFLLSEEVDHLDLDSLTNEESTDYDLFEESEEVDHLHLVSPTNEESEDYDLFEESEDEESADYDLFEESEEVDHLHWDSPTNEESADCDLFEESADYDLFEESEEVDHLHWDFYQPTLALRYYLLPSLQHLNLNNCGGISELPDNIGLCLPSLHTLQISETSLVTLPTSIKHLTKLTLLNVGHCRLLEDIPVLPPSFNSFVADNCTSLETLWFLLNSEQMSSQKNGLYIGLENCTKLSEYTREVIAMHYKLLTQRIVSASKENSNALLYLPGSKVPKCFRSCGARYNSVSAPLELPLHVKAMDFVFYFLTQNKSFNFELRIKCYIELSNVAKVQFICGSTGLPRRPITSDHVFLWCESSLNLKIMGELSRIEALAAATDDQYAKVWFELLDSKYRHEVEEWGVYPIFISSEP